MAKTTCTRCGHKDVQFCFGEPLCLSCLGSWYVLRDKLVSEAFRGFLAKETPCDPKPSGKAKK